jgi:hypothetical protein
MESRIYGFLMTSHKRHNNNKDYVCMYQDSEPNNNEKMFSTQESHRNALWCMHNINEIFKWALSAKIVNLGCP